MIGSLLKQIWRWHLKQQGLEMAPDCRFMGFPRFGSEPYLISIGRHVTISSGVSFITHDGGTWVFRDQPKYRRVIKYGRIIIHDNCFIGARSTVMPGLSIGPNSVVAAGSVVTKSVPPDTVAGGVPARVLCTLQEYAENALRNTPGYDVDAYSNDKKKELLRALPYPSAVLAKGSSNDELGIFTISRPL